MPREKQEQWVIPEPLRQKMTEVARTLRHTPTATENLLWQNLRGKQRGYKVRRQQPIGVFVVDFYIPQARLIVEIDGLIHTEQQDKDRERQALQDLRNCHKQWRGYTAPYTKQLSDQHGNIRTF